MQRNAEIGFFTELSFLAVFCGTNQAFARKIGLTTTSVENIGLTPAAADQYGFAVFWPIPSGTPY
jgi:hypothetical protein